MIQCRSCGRVRLLMSEETPALCIECADFIDRQAEPTFDNHRLTIAEWASRVVHGDPPETRRKWECK